MARVPVLPNADSLGPLRHLAGKWAGTGLNIIWRPMLLPPGQQHFLELNLTLETTEFEIIPGRITNRGLCQDDIDMFGLTYLQKIQDRNTGAVLHVEPGVWARVPATTDPAVPESVVRMASIPHGASVLAQGLAATAAEPPRIGRSDIVPFVTGQPNRRIALPPEADLAVPSDFRSPPGATDGITQAMLDDPNSLLTQALDGASVLSTTTLHVSSDPAAPVPGGGVVNTAFLQGTADGPNAQAGRVTATFWIETLRTSSGGTALQLQYSQTVLLNFAGLSWPHVSVATLRKV
ncbi:MAG TPA: heme-binding protein [Acetobacteraceae bacterium]|nr:heme-binding protein [Acetobacteraceae bacterium]